MRAVLREFYGQPERAVPFLILFLSLMVALLTRSPFITVLTAMASSLCWRHWSARLVIHDTRLGPITLDCPSRDEVGRPQVWLTFDDGPDTETLKIVELLNDYGQKATFFFIGEAVESYEQIPALYAALKSGGHSVANHTLQHLNLLKLNYAETERQILSNQKILDQHFPGLTTPLFRPPFGYRDQKTLSVADRHNLQIVGWNINSLDFLPGPYSEIVERVRAQIRPGAIILFHDGGGQRSRTTYALASLLTLLENQGFGAYTPR